MSVANRPTNRPLSPHLTIYKPTLTMIHDTANVMAGESPIRLKLVRQVRRVAPSSWRPKGHHPRLLHCVTSVGVDDGPSLAMTV